MGNDIPGAVVKVIDVIGSSPDSFSQAVKNAVKVASQSIRGIKGVEVVSTTAEVTDQGDISNFKAHCKIAFIVESDVGG